MALQSDIQAFVLSLELTPIGCASLCRRLRSMDRYRYTPLIFITQDAGDSRVADVFTAGADDFIVSPMNTVTVLARLRGHLQRMDYLNQVERARSSLMRYVSTRTQEMVDAFSATGLRPEPECREACVLFADVRGFTNLTSSMDVSTLFYVLSRHLAMQVDCVYRYGGSVDRFGGDGVMAIFDGPAAPQRACYCGLEILDVTRRQENGGARLLPVGIGIHRGSVFLGNIGSDEHLNYSAIGETVDIAARLCGYAEALSIVVSDAVVETIVEQPGLMFNAPRQVDVRGVSEPVVVYALEGDASPRARPVRHPRAQRSHRMGLTL